MYAERLRQQGELAAWHLAGVAAVMPFVNARLDPHSINPYRATGAGAKVEAVKAFIAGRGLASFGSMMAAAGGE